MLTRKDGFNLLQSFGYYREAVNALKHGYVVCGLSERESEVSELLIKNKCFSNINVGFECSKTHFIFSKGCVSGSLTLMVCE